MKRENWSSHIGVILAVAGSAVGLGNFLKFPGQVATYGGASFMIAYVISFFFIALPLSIVEWTMGREGGLLGFNSPVGIFHSLWKNKCAKYMGVLAVMLTTIVFSYYIYIEAWCLGYAVNFAFDNLHFKTLAESAGFFNEFTGISADGGAFSFSFKKLLPYFLIVFVLNFYIIYRGVSKGIEFFCKYAMPMLFLLGLILVVRVMCLGTPDISKPEQSLNTGLGFMWNPEQVFLEKFDSGKNEWVQAERLVGTPAIARGESVAAKSPNEFRVVKISLLKQLLNPQIWIAAAGQVFFSLTVGFCAIMTYASYIKKNDDIVLGAVSAASTNEFCEVCIGGLITVPAAVAFFGVSATLGSCLSLFDLGFKILPVFFSSLWCGALFGFMFFSLLFLGAVTSSLSMLQPAIAFFGEAVKFERKHAVWVMIALTVFPSFFVAYFSKNLKALDTFDFWCGQVCIYILTMIMAAVFVYVIGTKRGIRMANRGSLMKAPIITAYILQYFAPFALFAIFILWISKEVKILFGGKSSYFSDIIGKNPDKIAVMSVCIMLFIYLFFAGIAKFSKTYKSRRLRK